jgi:hypothetical protein
MLIFLPSFLLPRGQIGGLQGWAFSGVRWRGPGLNLSTGGGVANSRLLDKATKECSVYSGFEGLSVLQ